MLEYLRNASEKPIAKVLITVLAFSFVGWGVAEWIFGGAVGDNTLVTVGGAKISAQQFSNAKSRALSEMSREQQRETYNDPTVMQEFTDSVMAKLSAQQMAENRAKDLGFVVSDKRIASEIRSFPEFQENGKFSIDRFDMLLSNNGWSETAFANMLRVQHMRSMVLGGVAFPMVVPQFAKTAAYNARYTTRDIEYSTVDFKSFDVGTPSDEQLRTFYNQNPHTIAEVRNISYVLIPTKMDQPDSYDAGFKTAQSVEDDIIAGGAMSDVAKSHNVKYVSVKDLHADSAATDDVMTHAMISRMFSMDEGTESELIETKAGFVIARVDKVIPEHNAEFDTVKGGLVNAWRQAEQKKQAYVRANEILVDLNKNGTLQGKKSVNVSRASGAPIAVLNAAFNGAVGANSIVEDSGAFYVLHIGTEKMPKSDSAKMANIQTELQNASERHLSDDYNAFLKRKYPVKVNKRVFDRFFAK